MIWASAKFLALVVGAALLLGGCVSPVGSFANADIIKALAQDPATVCFRISNPVYGALTWYRTNVQGGSAKCDSDGMAVQGGTLPNAPAGSTVVAPPGASVITAPKPTP